MALNSQSTNKATRSQVKLGSFEIEGYLLPESLWTDSNKFGVSKTQAVLLAYPDYDRTQASKLYARIIKNSTSIEKGNKAQKPLTASLNLHPKIAVEAEGRDARVIDLLPLDSLLTFLKIAKRQGSESADSLIDDLAGLSLQQLFSDSFKLKFDADDRQDWLKMRQKTIEDFWFLTASIQDYYETNPRIENYKGENYSRVFDAVNVGLFAKTAKTIKKELGIAKGGLNRDHFGEESLKRIDMIQRLAQAQIEHHGCEPKEAVLKSLAIMRYPIIHYED